jgi:hypothetical protein
MVFYFATHKMAPVKKTQQKWKKQGGESSVMSDLTF